MLIRITLMLDAGWRDGWMWVGGDGMGLGLAWIVDVNVEYILLGLWT